MYEYRYLGVSLCQIDNKQARELLAGCIIRYPELELYYETYRMIENCRDFGISEIEDFNGLRKNKLFF
jgi:hypothetical protein